MKELLTAPGIKCCSGTRLPSGNPNMLFAFLSRFHIYGLLPLSEGT